MGQAVERHLDNSLAVAFPLIKCTLAVYLLDLGPRTYNSRGQPVRELESVHGTQSEIES